MITRSARNPCRGWKYRCYADEMETPITDFICAVVGGMIGFFNFIGWLPAYFGWVSPTMTFLISLGAGILLAGWLAYEAKTIKH